MMETEERLLLRRVCASKLNLSSHSRFDHLSLVSDNLLTDLRDDRNDNDNQFSV